MRTSLRHLLAPAYTHAFWSLPLFFELVPRFHISISPVLVFGLASSLSLQTTISFLRSRAHLYCFPVPVFCGLRRQVIVFTFLYPFRAALFANACCLLAPNIRSRFSRVPPAISTATLGFFQLFSAFRLPWVYPWSGWLPLPTRRRSCGGSLYEKRLTLLQVSLLLTCTSGWTRSWK